ncbi:MAG: acetolactate synthase [Phycisphaerales bacterium]|nr:acetolactate synthase [Phycisphaerales bacterium]
MSEASTPVETTKGYCPPTVTQVSVFLDNRVGKLYDLVEAFADAPDCFICALSVHEAADHAVVRLISNNARAAKQLLRDNKLPFCELDVLVVEISKGHTLSSLCLSLLGAELNIQFAYPLMLRPNGTPTIALAVDDKFLGGEILRRKGFRLLGEADIRDVH